MFRNAVVAGAVAVTLALPVYAEEAVVSHPIQAASIHEGPLDMVAYFQPINDDTYEVTATFAPHDAAGAPMRIVMAMRDGDAANFAMPGYREASYTFARKGDQLSVNVDASERTALAN